MLAALFLTMAFLTLRPLPARADSPWEACVFSASDGQALRYRMLKPGTPGPWPMILFLHGAGERGDDNVSQLKNGAAELFEKLPEPCLVVAPQCPEGRKWVEVPWTASSHQLPENPSPSLAEVMALFNSLGQSYPVDPRRLYAVGLSMGGYGVWDLLARWPDRFAAAVPICGGGDESTAPRLASIPLWVFHGAEDPVVPTSRSRHMVEALREAGGKPRYTEYPGVGHTSWEQAFAEPELLTWLLSQHRS